MASALYFSLEHEVLPAWRPRTHYDVVPNRRDTALEAWAEEMREKKASGSKYKGHPCCVGCGQ